jgi:hypothetical protein
MAQRLVWSNETHVTGKLYGRGSYGVLVLARHEPSLLPGELVLESKRNRYYVQVREIVSVTEYRVTINDMDYR